MEKTKQIKKRLEYLHNEILEERISLAELAELQGLAEYIDKNDVLLLEWAGVPEENKQDYSLEKDHANIKKQIKEWEIKLDQLRKDLQTVYDENFLGDIKVIQDKLEVISHEMISINI